MRKVANVLVLMGILGSIVVVASRILFGPGILPLIGVANATALMGSSAIILVGLGLSQVIKK